MINSEEFRNGNRANSGASGTSDHVSRTARSYTGTTSEREGVRRPAGTTLSQKVFVKCTICGMGVTVWTRSRGFLGPCKGQAKTTPRRQQNEIWQTQVDPVQSPAIMLELLW